MKTHSAPASKRRRFMIIITALSLALITCCAGDTAGVGKIEVRSGATWREFGDATIPETRDASKLNYALPFVVKRELDSSLTEVSSVTERVGLQRPIVIQDRGGLMILHMALEEIGGGLDWQMTPHAEQPKGWMSGVVLIEGTWDEPASPYFFGEYAIGLIWRQDGQVRAAFLSRDPVEYPESAFQGGIDLGESMGFDFDSIRSQTDFAGKWSRSRFIMQRYIGGRFRQIEVFGHDKDGSRISRTDHATLASFIAENIGLEGEPTDGGVDKYTKGILHGGPNLWVFRGKMSLLFLIREGVKLNIAGKEVNGFVTLVWDSGNKRFTFGECL